MSKRPTARSAHRRQYAAGLIIAGAALVGLAYEIVYMMSAVPT